jgi:hypothetical protein
MLSVCASSEPQASLSVYPSPLWLISRSDQASPLKPHQRDCLGVLCRLICGLYIMASVRSIASSRCWQAQLRRACHTPSRSCSSIKSTSKHATLPAFRSYTSRRLQSVSALNSKRTYATAPPEKKSETVVSNFASHLNTLEIRIDPDIGSKRCFSSRKYRQLHR